MLIISEPVAASVRTLTLQKAGCVIAAVLGGSEGSQLWSASNCHFWVKWQWLGLACLSQLEATVSGGSWGRECPMAVWLLLPLSLTSRRGR